GIGCWLITRGQKLDRNRGIRQQLDANAALLKIGGRNASDYADTPVLRGFSLHAKHTSNSDPITFERRNDCTETAVTHVLDDPALAAVQRHKIQRTIIGCG